MKITEIIGKIVSGAEITPEEKEFLSGYQEPEARERIPKSRLDQEIARKKELEQRIEEMARQLDEYENRGLSETEKNRKTIDTLNQRIELLTRERDDIRSAKEAMDTRNRIAELAAKINFDDHAYLEFLVNRDRQDIADEESMAGYVAELKKNCPKHFRVDIAPGSGSGGKTGVADVDFESARNCGDIDRMIAHAPAV